MSYCRFSSDDSQSDVYCYEDSQGLYHIDVASERHVFKEALPPKVDFATAGLQPFIDRALKVKEMVEEADTEPIGLSEDGGHFLEMTAGDTIDRLMELRREGYHVPDHAIAALEDRATIEDLI